MSKLHEFDATMPVEEVKPVQGLTISADEFDASGLDVDAYVGNPMSKVSLAISAQCMRNNIPSEMCQAIIIETLLCFKAIDETFMRLIHQAVSHRDGVEVMNILHMIANVAFGEPPAFPPIIDPRDAGHA